MLTTYMVENYEPKQVFNLIIDDFVRAWECLAKVDIPSKPDTLAGGNVPRKRQGPMFFGFLSMNLLEYICRLCANNKPALLEFSNNLNIIESKYFIHLPLAGLSAKRDCYSLPYVDKNHRGDLLLTLLFDTIRNGLAHLYQPTIVSLKDGNQLYFVLKGASGRINRMKNSNHLCYDFDGIGNIRILVYPEYLLQDFQQAAKASGLFDKQLQIEPFPKNGKIDIQRLDKALRSGGATRCHVGRVHITHP